MSKGWIKVYRSILAHDIWMAEPFSMGQAWVDLILMANHTDHRAMIRGEWIECHRGEVNRSISQLSDRWKWTRKKTKKFLDMLDSEGMLRVATDRRYTTIKILNYDEFQMKKKPEEGTTEGTTEPPKKVTTEVPTDGTTQSIDFSNKTPISGTTNGATDGTTNGTTNGATKGQQRDTYKNDKELKNINNNTRMDARARAREGSEGADDGSSIFTRGFYPPGITPEGKAWLDKLRARRGAT